METGREVDDMNQMEVKGVIAGDGSLILPPGVLETMGAGPGDPVYLAYGSPKPVRAENSYGRLFLSAEGFWKAECMETPEEAEIKLPHVLLETGCRAGGPDGGRGGSDREGGTADCSQKAVLRNAPAAGYDRERGYGDLRERRIFGWVNPCTSWWIRKDGC